MAEIYRKKEVDKYKNNIIIKADEFEYDKKLNILKANGKVEIINIVKNLQFLQTNNLLQRLKKE